MSCEEVALWFAFCEDRLLVYRRGQANVPEAGSLEDLGLNAAFEQEIGFLEGRRCFAVDLSPATEPPEETMFRDLRGLWSVDEAFFLMAGRAKQIVEWHRTHRFCGRDGTETVPELPPRVSIARRMIEEFVAGHRRDQKALKTVEAPE